jgi:hypothetical protein
MPDMPRSYGRRRGITAELWFGRSTATSHAGKIAKHHEDAAEHNEKAAHHHR